LSGSTVVDSRALTRDTSRVTNLRVVVADDHQLTLSGVADSLTANGIQVVGRARSAPEAISLVNSLTPDALISDLDFGPGPTGLDIAAHLRKQFPRLGIVVLSAYGDPRLHHTSLDDAPRGLVYLIKQQVLETSDIVTALRRSILRAEKAEAGELPSVNLTHGQISVLRLIAQGFSNQAIAEQLSVTEESVSKTINRMLKRLGIASGPTVNSRAALVQSFFDLVGANR
jgi:DNA-binding NarL/FixJ family response regulator